MFSNEYFDCTKCHVVGEQLPSGSQDTWAPNLALAGKRLKPEWVIRWMKNPSAIVPGTKMPTFYDPSNYAESGPPDILNGDEDEQIRVLRNFVMSISTHPPTGPLGGEHVPTYQAAPAPNTPEPSPAETDFWGEATTPPQK